MSGSRETARAVVDGRMHRGRAAAESPRIYLDRVERRVAGFFALAGFLALFLALFGAAFFGVAFLTVAGFLALFLALAAGFLAGVFLAGFLALRVLTGATICGGVGGEGSRAERGDRRSLEFASRERRRTAHGATDAIPRAADDVPCAGNRERVPGARRDRARNGRGDRRSLERFDRDVRLETARVWTGGRTAAAAAALARRGRFDGVGVGLETVFFLAGFDFFDFFVSLTAMVAAATAPPTTRAVGFSAYSPDRVSRMASIL